MAKGRKIGAIALLGGSIAALAMLTGLGGARADDLKVNQQLLSERLDQLAAVGQQPGAGAYLGVDQGPAAGAPVTGGSFPRSILIPGTETSLKIYGQMTEVIDYFLSGGGGNNPGVNGLPSTTLGANGGVQLIPLHNSIGSARGNGVFQQTPRESKIGFETRTPTAFGEARTVLEWDWTNGNQFDPGAGNPQGISDNLIPRLRYAYGTLGGLLAGQATSNFADPDSNTECLDMGCNVGEAGIVRVAQVRYTMPAWWGGSFSVSAEAPSTQLGTPAGTTGQDAGFQALAIGPCAVVGAVATCPAPTLVGSGLLVTNFAKATAPPLTAAYYIPQPWGHFSMSAVVLPGLDVTDGHFLSKSYVGFGGHMGMDFKPGWFGWAKDDFTFQMTGGQAIGTYLNSSTNFELASNFIASPATAAAAAALEIKPTNEFGFDLGYTHWWMDNLRSNFNYGFNHHDIQSQIIVPTGPLNVGQAAAQNKELMTSHINVIWNPVSSVDIGVEWMWGQRQVVNNQSATMNAIISKFAFRF
jgi:hypothetical protein